MTTVHMPDSIPEKALRDLAGFLGLALRRTEAGEYVMVRDDFPAPQDQRTATAVWMETNLAAAQGIHFCYISAAPAAEDTTRRSRLKVAA